MRHPTHCIHCLEVLPPGATSVECDHCAGLRESRRRALMGYDMQEGAGCRPRLVLLLCAAPWVAAMVVALIVKYIFGAW